ncbi:MAG TPA: single-stranded DNA-binding protein [Chitinophagaceae bacterium]|nr:single-stranded DNA-binding protein [Chitinophagaceae bacterium]
MRGVNKVTLIGNLGKDPEVQVLEGNISVAKFSLATTETFRDRSGRQISQTEWHTVVLWRGLAELAQKHLHKGSLVYIEGRLHRSWEDKDKKKKFATEIVGDTLVMLDKRLETNGGIPSPPIRVGSQALPTRNNFRPMGIPRANRMPRMTCPSDPRGQGPIVYLYLWESSR